jgi:hypothetical protein
MRRSSQPRLLGTERAALRAIWRNHDLCVECGVEEFVFRPTSPALPAPPASTSFANPKSSTFTVPSARTLMLAGLRSRWTTPASCAASSASAICFAIGSASSSGIGPRAMRSASDLVWAKARAWDEGQDGACWGIYGWDVAKPDGIAMPTTAGRYKETS